MKNLLREVFLWQAMWQGSMCVNPVLMKLLGVFKRSVRFNNSFGRIKSECVFVHRLGSVCLYRKRLQAALGQC